jgi:hypothetical protein
VWDYKRRSKKQAQQRERNFEAERSEMRSAARVRWRAAERSGGEEVKVIETLVLLLMLSWWSCVRSSRGEGGRGSKETIPRLSFDVGGKSLRVRQGAEERRALHFSQYGSSNNNDAEKPSPFSSFPRFSQTGRDSCERDGEGCDAPPLRRHCEWRAGRDEQGYESSAFWTNLRRRGRKDMWRRREKGDETRVANHEGEGKTTESEGGAGRGEERERDGPVTRRFRPREPARRPS